MYIVNVKYILKKRAASRQNQFWMNINILHQIKNQRYIPLRQTNLIEVFKPV